MKALRFYGIKDLRLEEIPEPEPAVGEELLKIASVGICGSDVHYYKEGGTGSLQLDQPLILGHEFSAWFVSGPEKGRLVAVDPALPCGVCEFCREGNPNFCVHLDFAGAENKDGALQEKITWPESALYTLPEAFTPQEAALLEPLGVAIHAQRLGNISPGMTVGVFGAGPIGLLTIQMARAAGATRIITTDRIPDRLEYAAECGATDLFIADGQEHQDIIKATGDRGLDVTFETAGDDGAAVETSILTAKRGGTVVLVGIPSEDETRFTASAARRRGLTIKLSRRMKNTYPAAIDLVSKGLVDLQPLITHQFPIEDYQEAFETASQRIGIKIVINMGT